MAKNEKATIIIKKIKKASHGGHGGAWKVAYADFVTAMMAFFLVMWLMGTDEETKAAVEGYFKNPGSTSPLSTSPTDPKGGEKLNVFEDRNPASGRPLDMPAGKTAASQADTDELQHLKDVLEETISLEVGVTNHSDQLEMVYDSKGLVLRVAVKNFFNHGESDVKEDLLPILFRIGKVLSKTHRSMRIEGHTDHTERGPDGMSPAWDLSTARAASVIKYWTKSFPNLKPENIEIAGRADYHPIGDDSQAGLASNRRVEVIILNESAK